MSGFDRVAAVVGLIAAVTTAVAWFLGDVSRIARIALFALALAALILYLVPPKRRFRLLASAPLVLFAVLVLLPGTRSWLLEQGEKPRDGLKGPPLVIEDVRPAWDSGTNSQSAQRFRVSIVIRNRASEPVVINRALLGYHQGGGGAGGASSDIWLQDQVLAVHETDTGQTLEIRQSDSPNGQFAVRASAFAAYVGDVWDQILVLRPQATIPARSLHTLHVTVPLTLRLSVIRNTEGEDVTVVASGKQADLFVRFSQGQFDDFPRLLTVTVNTTGGDCARKTTVLEPGKNPSARPRTSAFLGKTVSFGKLCSWSPPRPPAVN